MQRLVTNRVLGASTQLHAGTSTARIMWSIALSLLPAGAWGVWVFGLRSLVVIAVAVVAAIAAELVVGIFRRIVTIWDGSAVLTGLLIGYMMGPGVPLYVPLAASFFAIIVIKGTFGGLGANWMNPAAGGQAFAYASWGTNAAWWAPVRFPGPPHGLVQPPLAELAKGGSGAAPADGPFALLSAAHYPATSMAHNVSAWLASEVGVRIDPHAIDLLVGADVGWIGAVSVPLLCAGAAYLLAARLIEWRIPLSFGASFFAFVWLFDGIRSGGSYLLGWPILNLLTGGFILSVFYLATDPVTSPLTRAGTVAYAVALGLVAGVLRVFGRSEEAVVFAVILMNMAVPAINQLVEGRRRAHRR